ncbi:LysM peptidoglycan-binding domain-containing protein [uncultured Luteimonas sp.]|uniref:LysM peptidoglycan-binding domain-containing protein n=1 Tax=uncultured Luteimonas sp. TaxID=453144 RepID=UPI0026316088|nr:LysM peptidoglycan-binding domain-containing protein [uncultured Luteimonas sp.]
MSVNAVDHASHADSGTNRAGDHLSPDGFDYNRIQGLQGNPNVTEAFLRGVEEMAGRLGTRPEYILAVMSFETGGSFSPGVRNGVGSGATGLIQFMPTTARELGTSTDALARMSAVEQLEYVERYFAQRSDPGDLNTLEGVYTTVLYGSPRPDPGSTLFSQGGAAYRMNAPLDLNRDGRITAGEATSFVRNKIDGDAPAPIEGAPPRPDPGDAPPAEGSRYTVRPGDTLSAIAARFGTTAQALAQSNGIRNPDLIHAGTTLRVPAGEAAPAPATSYTIRPGDTLSEIAGRMGTTVQALAQANGIRNPDLIHAGNTLSLPAGAATSASYTIQPGDTLSGLAARFSTSVGALMAANPGIRDSNLIHAGDTLALPGAAGRGDAPAGGTPPETGPRGDAPPVSGTAPTYAPYTVYSTGHQAAFAVSDASQMQPHHDYQTVTRNGQQLEVRDIVLHRNGQSQTSQAIPAPLQGEVIHAGPKGGAGNAVGIRGADGKVAWVFHMSSIDVRVGQQVGYGQDLGNQGSTGNSTGPHVHIEAAPAVIDRWVNDLVDGRFDGRKG